MARKVWTGATDGDYNTAGNWSPAGVPAAADDVDIDGSVSMDAATVANDPATFNVLPSYLGTIGASITSPLVMTCTTLNYCGGRGAYIDGDHTYVNVDTPNMNAPGLYLDGATVGAGIGEIYAARGLLQLRDDVLISTMLIGYGSQSCTVISSAKPSAVAMYGGSYRQTNTAGSIYMAGGWCYMDGTWTSSPALIMMGGVAQYEGDVEFTVRVDIVSGTLFCSSAVLPRTANRFAIYEQGTVDVRSHWKAPVNAGAVKINNFGGTFKWNGETLESQSLVPMSAGIGVGPG